MTGEGFKRKLAAILSADVEGYSRLMGQNEEQTIRTLTSYRTVISEIVQQYRGSVVDSPGDNILAEFGSVVDAVKCAVKIQTELAERNADLPMEQRMQFRIGINLGEVVEEEDRIYGDGVNLAARVESMAKAGGICISGRVYDQVENKLEWQYYYLGEKKVKNISRPIRVYKLLMKPKSSSEVASEERMALPLPDKPSIAVLPFDNMSGDPSQEYFSDGLTEQIINGLCKVNNLFVIARNSSFAYRGKSISIKQIAQELGVKYILEGSVQKAGDRLRITAQLINATTDYHMWSESYDRDLSDIFALQDEITLRLMEIMEINLTFGEQARLWAGGTTNIQAYDRLMRGSDCFFRNNEKDNKQARQFFKESISIDITYAIAYVYLGYTHMFDLLYGWSKSTIESFEQAEMNVEKALALNDSLDVARSLLGCLYLLKRQHDKAIVEGERAIELNPNGAEAHALFAFILCWSDNVDLAIKLLKRAFRLNPFPLPHYYIIMAMGYRINGQYDKAIEWAKKGLGINPDQLTPYLTLAASYSSLNHTEKARKAVEEALRIDPNFSLEYFANMLP
jgi:adenylate cyclase